MKKIQSVASVVFVVGLSLLAISCENMNIERREVVKANVSDSKLAIKNKLKVKTLWTRYVGSNNEQEFSKLSPSIGESAIYTVSAQGKVIAWEKERSRVLWKAELNETITAGIFVGYGLALVGSGEGKVTALDSSNGEELWHTQLTGEVLSSPQSNGRYVIVQTADGKVHGLNAKDGVSKWTYSTSVPALTLRGTGVPILEKGMAYVGFANGKVAALDTVTGTARWEVNLFLPEGGTELERVVDVDGSLILDDLRVFGASLQGKVAALSKENGRPIWKNTASNYVGIERGLGSIYSVEEDGTLRAFDQENGAKLWQQDILKGRLLGAPSVQQNYLVVGDSEGYLYWFDQTNGAILAKKRLTRGPVAEYHAGVFNFKAQRQVEKVPTDFRIFSKSVVKDGVLYVQNQYGILAAYQVQEL